VQNARPDSRVRYLKPEVLRGKREKAGTLLRRVGEKKSEKIPLPLRRRFSENGGGEERGVTDQSASPSARSEARYKSPREKSDRKTEGRGVNIMTVAGSIRKEERKTEAGSCTDSPLRRQRARA